MSGPSSSDSPSPVLVIGSTGKVGARVASRLEERGLSVRGVTRRSTPRFDWFDDATWGEALEGASSAYVSFAPDLAMFGADGIIQRFVRCAKAAGLQRLVLLSGRGERGAERCEAVVSASGLEWAVVRASWFFQNFTEGMLLDAVTGGTLFLPAGDVAEPLVDAEDIADVAVAALTGPAPNMVYEVTGPRLMTFEQVARELSHASGRPVNYVPATLEEFREAVTAVAGASTAELLTAICAEVFTGKNQWLGDGVSRATGKKPTDFAQFCKTAAASGVWS